jgi:hypothetical protein
MTTDYQLEAKQRVVAFFNDFRLDGVPEIGIDSVYIVWFSKILKNWKALVSTVIPDEMYYEVTFNGETNETYIDAYSKLINVAISDGDIDDNQLPIPFEDNNETESESQE